MLPSADGNTPGSPALETSQSSQNNQMLLGASGAESDGEHLIKSGLSSFTNGSANNSSANSMVQLSKFAPANSIQMVGCGPLETESNLNYADDHQESPIDLINETAKMKHLS